MEDAKNKVDQRVRVDFTYPEHDKCLIEETDLKEYAKKHNRPEDDFLEDDLIEDYIRQYICDDEIEITSINFPE